MPTVRFRRLSPRATLPFHATPGAAGLDLSMAAESLLILWPGDRQLVPTGWAVEIPPGYEAQVRPRSGLALKWIAERGNHPNCIRLLALLRKMKRTQREKVIRQGQNKITVRF